MIRQLFDRLGRWWFQPMPAKRLAAVRIAVGLYCLFYLGLRSSMFERIFRTSADLFAPVGLARVLDAPLPAPVMDGVYWVTLLLAVLFTVGAKARVVGPLFGLSLLALLSYRNSWSMILHMHNGLVVHALILGWAASSDAWSFDAWRESRNGAAGPPADSWRYGLPVMLVAATATISYFLSGVAKLAGPEGLAWASGEALRAQVSVNAIRYDILTPIGSAPLFVLLIEQTWLFWLMGLGTFVLELGAPLALAHRKVGKLWALATFGLHWGIFFIMGIKFRYQMSGAAFVAFFDGEKVTDILRRGRLFRVGAKLWPRARIAG